MRDDGFAFFRWHTLLWVDLEVRYRRPDRAEWDRLQAKA